MLVCLSTNCSSSTFNTHGSLAYNIALESHNLLFEKIYTSRSSNWTFPIAFTHWLLFSEHSLPQIIKTWKLSTTSREFSEYSREFCGYSFCHRSWMSTTHEVPFLFQPAWDTTASSIHLKHIKRIPIFLDAENSTPKFIILVFAKLFFLGGGLNSKLGFLMLQLMRTGSSAS